MAGSLVAVVSDHVREGIVSGAYRAGFALSEVALAAELDVSRTPVREALKQLETEGLVRIVPRVGTFVAAASRRDVVELHELKEVFEGLAARLLARRGAVPQIVALERNVADADAAVRRGDLAACAALVRDFHDLVVDGADSRKLALTYRWHMNQLSHDRHVATTLAIPGRAAASVDEHRLIVERIAAKDAHGAEQAMRAHVRAALQALMEAA